MSENSKKYSHVFLIGVDGAGNFFKDTDTPNIDRIFANGAVSYDVVTAFPAISAECWGAMLIGATAETHGLTNDIVSSVPYPVDSSLPTLFRRIRESIPDAALASFSNWNPINEGIIESNLNVVFGTGNDDQVAEEIVSYLDGTLPTFLFAQFDSVDDLGHMCGYGSERHLAQITYVDTLIGKVYDKIASLNALDDTLFLVISDHGGTPEGTHGNHTDAEKYIFFGASGKTVNNYTFSGMNVQDTAAVVLNALGLDIPEAKPDSFCGVVPDGLFSE